RGTIFKNMKNYDDVIGIDVSKLTIDAHMHRRSLHRVFSNPIILYRSAGIGLEDKGIESILSIARISFCPATLLFKILNFVR
ncbi:hypothetical protein CA834_14545, partial [Winogradskyella aurantia]